MTAIIRVEGVSHWYGTGSKTEALRDIDLEIQRSEFVTLIGPSGCGKSTLLNLIGGLAEPSKGRIVVDGEEVQGPNPAKIAMMFQEYTLYPWRNLLRNVEFGLELKGVPKERREEIAKKYVDLVGLSGFLDKLPSELSGGMKQRAALARSLTLETPILLMDEPFGALDEQTRIILGEELTRIWEKTKKTILFVTHSLFEAAHLSDRVIVMSARPATVKDVVRVDVPRPRDPNSPALDSARAKIWEQLQAESIKMVGLRTT